MNEEPDAYAWEHAAEVVSLDLTASFLPGLGLTTVALTPLREATREAIATTNDDDRPWKAQWLTEVERILGATGREAIVRWVQYGFATAPSTHEEWIAWNTVFGLVERSVAGFQKLGLPEESIPHLLEAYTRSRATEELTALEDRVRGADLSIWDLQACASFGFLPDEDEADDVLWGWIHTTWDNHHFQIFFGEVIAALDDAALARLWQRGQILRRAEELDVDRLVDPRTLRPAVPWAERAR